MPRSAPTGIASITATAPGPSRLGQSEIFPETNYYFGADTFLNDLEYMDMLEAAEDEELFRMLGVNGATTGSATTGSSKDVYDAILQASAATDTAGEYLADVAAAQQGVDIALANLSANTGTDVTTYDPAQEAATAAAIGELTTAKENLTAAQQAALGSGLVSEIDLGGDTFAQSVLSGVGNVLGTGTGALYNVASNIPVVGGALGDAIEGTADWFKNMEGVVSINPITGAVQGTWGELPPWMEKQTVTQIGTIPGSQTKAGVTTGTIFDDIISIGRGEQDIGDVFEDRTGQVASTIGIDPVIIAAAAAAGKTVKDYLEDKAEETALAPETDTTTEKETTATIDLSSGPDSDVLNEVLGPQQVETVTGEEAIDPTSPNQILTVGDGADVVDTLLGDGKLEDTGAGGYEEVVSTRIVGDGLTFEPPVPPEEPPEPPEPPEEPPEPPEEPPEPPEASPSFFGLSTKPGELVDINYLYDIAGPSIFAPKMEEEDEYDPLGMYSPYAEGGIVQDYDIEELIRYLAETRG